MGAATYVQRHVLDWLWAVLGKPFYCLKHTSGINLGMLIVGSFSAAHNQHNCPQHFDETVIMPTINTLSNYIYIYLYIYLYMCAYIYIYDHDPSDNMCIVGKLFRWDLITKTWHVTLQVMYSYIHGWTIFVLTYSWMDGLCIRVFMNGRFMYSRMEKMRMLCIHVFMNGWFMYSCDHEWTVYVFMSTRTDKDRHRWMHKNGQTHEHGGTHKHGRMHEHGVTHEHRQTHKHWWNVHERTSYVFIYSWKHVLHIYAFMDGRFMHSGINWCTCYHFLDSWMDSLRVGVSMNVHVMYSCIYITQAYIRFMYSRIDKCTWYVFMNAAFMFSRIEECACYVFMHSWIDGLCIRVVFYIGKMKKSNVRVKPCLRPTTISWQPWQLELSCKNQKIEKCLGFIFQSNCMLPI